MLPSYKSSTSFLKEQRLSLGDGHKLIPTTQMSEMHHLMKLFRNANADRDDITATLSAIRGDESGAFTEEQRTQLMEIVSGVMTSAEATLVDAAAAGAQKMQTHAFSFNYYNEETWSLLCSDKPNPTKFREISRQWISWGLRFPSGPTFRIGLATILASTSTEISPLQAHSLIGEFNNIFKDVRDAHSGDATLRVFPSQPRDFKSMYPDLALPVDAMVDSRVPEKKIREFTNKRCIPLRGNNSLIKTTKPEPSTSNASTASCTMTPDMLRMILDQRSLREPFRYVPPPLKKLTVDANIKLEPASVTSDTPQPEVKLEPTPADAPVMDDTSKPAQPIADAQSIVAANSNEDLDAKQSRRDRIDKLTALVGEHLSSKKAKRAMEKEDAERAQDGAGTRPRYRAKTKVQAKPKAKSKAMVKGKGKPDWALKLYPNGCGRCRHVRGCTPSCWAYAEGRRGQ